MQKILILPVAIIGSGKTTLAKVLSDICPLSFCHVQSDNMPRKFTAKHFQKHVLAAFEKHEVVFADKNNHLRMHRERLTQAFVERYPDGLIGMRHLLTVVALDWQVESHDPTKVLALCKMRVINRGEDHQCLTPLREPRFESIIYDFLSKRERLDTAVKADALIHRVLIMNLFGSIFSNVDIVCKEFGWNLPSHYYEK